MRLPTWWHILLVVQLAVRVAAGGAPTVCEEEACHCDSFTRLICNCTRDFTELTLRPDGAYRLPSTTKGIIIDGCSRVTFLPDTARNLIQLRNVLLKNVQHVVINERALAWSPYSRDGEMNPGLRIVIENCTVDEISSHAIQGRVNDIVISDSRLVNVKPFAFSSLTGVNSIEMIDNVYNNIEIQAFKKFTTANFLMRGGRVQTLPSRFLSDVEVTNLFRMEGVTVNYMYSLTFLVSAPKRVIIESNTFDTLEGDGFHMTTRGPISFRNNTVKELRKGAFFGFTLDLEVALVTGAQELVIDNNTVTNLQPSSLMYNRTRLTMRVDGLNVNQSCSCELAEAWRAFMKEQGATLACWYALEGHFVSMPTYIDSRCGAFKQNFWIFILIGILIVLVIVAVVIFFIVRRENEKKKKVQIVLPDGKTYRETELHIVVERAELLTTDL